MWSFPSCAGHNRQENAARQSASSGPAGGVSRASGAPCRAALDGSHCPRQCSRRVGESKKKGKKNQEEAKKNCPIHNFPCAPDAAAGIFQIPLFPLARTLCPQFSLQQQYRFSSFLRNSLCHCCKMSLYCFNCFSGSNIHFSFSYTICNLQSASSISSQVQNPHGE